MYHAMSNTRTLGFSLVELSIVLVILGLLVGGVLAGQSLIRASELRAVGEEYTRWRTATMAFKDKYFALPGDMANATAIWGKDATYCNAHTGTATANGTCNGNADGVMNNWGGGSTAGEVFAYWKQLSLAGLIEGTYSGIAGTGGGLHTVFGENAPRSRLSKGGWGLQWLSASPGDSATFAGNYGNFYTFGAEFASTVPLARVLKAEEAWNIDTKLDDGMPNTGNITARDRYACASSTSATDTAATYRVSDSGINCTLYFIKVF